MEYQSATEYLALKKGLDAVDLVLGRAVGEEVLEDRVHAGGDGGGVLAGLHIGRIGEEAEAVEGLGPGTLENLAAFIWRAMAQDFSGLWQVRVWREGIGDSCTLRAH